MTRTERSTSPRAMRKDRSESRSGLDKSVRKGGAGGHNWGSVKDEFELERDALEDEIEEMQEMKETKRTVDAAVNPTGAPAEVGSGLPPATGSEATSVSNDAEDDVEKAREIRAKGLQADLDLAAIARTSVGISHSPLK